MGNEENDDAKNPAGGENQASTADSPPVEEERGARVDAAKAFFRAMYAGEEPPEKAAGFGQSGGVETATQTACRNCEAQQGAARDAEAKAAESDQLYKRMAADFENYRRRMDRERDEMLALGVKKAAEAIMPALDDLDRAMQYLNPDTPTDKLLESVKLVGTRILQCMEQIGLKPIDAVGQLFDPKYHEPVQQVETTEHPDGVVMQELRRGYTMGDRVVRPALVNVASNSTGVSGFAAAAAQSSESALDSTLLDRSAVGDLEPQAAAPSQEEPTKVYDLEDVEVGEEKS
jgi:molecular chaperone GrpE